jgi:hypothetical protein
MSQKSGTPQLSSEQVLKDIRRATRRHRLGSLNEKIQSGAIVVTDVTAGKLMIEVEA